MVDRRSALDARIGGFTTVLLYLATFMIGAGFIMPSPPLKQPLAPGYHYLGAVVPPLRLEVPSLNIKAPILPIEINDKRVLDPPRNPRDVGWWTRSAKPGSAMGQTVLTGHTVHTGGGVMDRLGRIEDGAIVKVVTKSGTLEYATTSKVTYTTKELAKHSEELFTQERHPNRLVLITCSGWTGRGYTSNIVVFAKPLGVRDAEAPSTPAAPA